MQFNLPLGLTRLQNLFYRSPFPDKTIRVKLVKKISNWKDAIHALRDVEASERYLVYYVVSCRKIENSKVSLYTLCIK